MEESTEKGQESGSRGVFLGNEELWIGVFVIFLVGAFLGGWWSRGLRAVGKNAPGVVTINLQELENNEPTDATPVTQPTLIESPCGEWEKLGEGFSAVRNTTNWWELQENSEGVDFTIEYNYPLDEYVKISDGESGRRAAFKCPDELVQIRDDSRYLARWDTTVALIDLDRSFMIGLAGFGDEFPLKNVFQILLHESKDFFLVKTGWEGPPWLVSLVDFSEVYEGSYRVKKFAMPIDRNQMAMDLKRWTSDGVEMVAEKDQSIDYMGDVTWEVCEEWMSDNIELDIEAEQKLAESRSLAEYDIGGVECFVCNAMLGHGCIGVVREYVFGYEPGDDFIKLVSDKQWTGERK